MEHFVENERAGAKSSVECSADPIEPARPSGSRIKKGQCPALHPGFLKPRSVARGMFRIRPKLQDNLKIGIFAGADLPAWIRFSGTHGLIA